MKFVEEMNTLAKEGEGIMYNEVCIKGDEHTDKIGRRNRVQ